MAVIVLPNRAAGVRPPFYGVNWDSTQARGLALWYPIIGTEKETPAAGGISTTPLTLQNANAFRGAHPTYRHTLNVLKGSPNGYTSGPDNLTVSSEFSLSFWFKWDEGDVWCVVVSKAPDQSINSNQWDWGILAGSGLYYLIRNGTNTAGTSITGFFNTGRWHHWLAVMSPSSGRNTSALYIDGKLHTSFAGINATTATSNTATRYLQTGYLNSGQLADLRIYNRYLSAADAWELSQPSSRWDLYWQPARRAYLDIGAAPPASTQGPRSYHYMTHVWSK